MFETETVLILIAMASAIVGTLWNATRTGKAAIIALAVLTAGTAVYESQQKAAEKRRADQEAAAAKRNLALVVRAIQPPEIFDRAVLDGFRKIAKENGLYVSAQNIRENGSRIFRFKRLAEKGEIGGVVFLNVAARQRMFVRFANEEDLMPGIRNLLYGKWGNDDLSADWNAFALHTFEIAKDTLGDFVPGGTTFTGNFDGEAHRVSVAVTLPNGRPVGDVAFGTSFMTGLTGVPPIERGRRIHRLTMEQINK